MNRSTLHIDLFIYAYNLTDTHTITLSHTCSYTHE